MYEKIKTYQIILNPFPHPRQQNSAVVNFPSHPRDKAYVVRGPHLPLTGDDNGLFPKIDRQYASTPTWKAPDEPFQTQHHVPLPLNLWE